MILKTKSLSVHINVKRLTCRLSSTGVIYPVGMILARVSKGEARKLRKQLRQMGLPCLASAPRWR